MKNSPLEREGYCLCGSSICGGLCFALTEAFFQIIEYVVEGTTFFGQGLFIAVLQFGM